MTKWVKFIFSSIDTSPKADKMYFFSAEEQVFSVEALIPGP